MKTILKPVFLLFLATLLAACSNKGKICDNICHGMYDSLTQMQEQRNPESAPLPWAEHPTYEQYKRELEDGR